MPGEVQGQRSLAGYSPWGHKELDVTEWLTHIHPLLLLAQSTQLIFFPVVIKLKGLSLVPREQVQTPGEIPHCGGKKILSLGIQWI